MHNLVNALGWMLVHFLWQGCLVAAGYWLACRVTPRSAAGLRYWLGLASYALIVLLPLATLWWYLAPVPIVTAPEVALAALPAVEITTGYPVSAGELLRHGLEPAMPLIVALWILGVCLMSLRTAAGLYGARQLVRRGVRAVEAPVRRLADELRIEVGVRRAVRVLESSRVAVPTVVGWLEPVILLPASVLGRLPREQLALVLAHELAHVRRNDYLVNLLQLLVETLFFYHPAVAWLGHRVREDREHCCDDEVVARFGERLTYARALASLEQLRAPAAPALAATGGDLYHRVDRIVHCEPPRKSAGYTHVLLVALLAAVAAVGVRQGLDMESGPDGLRVVSLPAVSSSGRLGDLAGALGGGFDRFGQAERERAAIAEQAEQARVEREARLELERRQAALEAERAASIAARRPATEASATVGASRAVPVRLDRPVSRDVFVPVDVNGDEWLLASLDSASQQQPAPPPRLEAPAPVAPGVIRQVAPNYPFQAKQNGVEGQVKVAFTVDRRGRPRNVEVVRAEPADVFDKAAVKAIGKWRFEADDNVDEGQIYYQVFDFTQVESADEVEDGRRFRRCNRTGSNICGRHFDEANVRRYPGTDSG